jgi:TonB family protein
MKAMKTRTSSNLMLVFTVGILLALAIATLPTSTAKAGEVYATGISGGKTKPLVDIENKLVPPKERPIKEAPLTPRTPAEGDSIRTIEDAGKYQLYIEPMYPRKARLAMKQGVVDVQITFNKEGKMKDARVVHCSTPGWGFEQAVLAASLEARLNNNTDREITVKATLKFQLE